ncbi:hypothetical protein LCGC14_2205500 [marine sediment metagenome]|uniref:Acylphosphatase-like domain-containing protein n=1 Tax=marine sediment metagenome TaxID=412755 RepID=A0A0F9GB81_9ZZZZ
MALERRLVHYSGTVQGVGFRYTTVRVAAGFDVTGYVRNVRDGRVELLVEGDAAQIDAFLAELADRMGYYIRHVDQQSGQATGQYPGFEVRY